MEVETVAPAAVLDDVDALAALQRRTQERRSAAPSPESSTSKYPRILDLAFACTRPGCGSCFRAPIVFLGPRRRMGARPTLCPGCVEADAAREARAAAERAARATAPKAEAVDVLAAMRRAGGNPNRYGTHTFAAFGATSWQARLVQSAGRWVDLALAASEYGEVPGAYVCGPNGTGKTLVAHLVLRQLLEAGLQPGPGVIFDDAATLIARIQDTYTAGESAWQLIERRIRTRVWILDDLGTEAPSDDAARKLSVIVNQREGRPVWITSNYLVEHLVERNPELFRLQARVAGYRLIRVDGPNLRVPANRAALDQQLEEG